jgi:hypothetical protein
MAKSKNRQMRDDDVHSHCFCLNVLTFCVKSYAWRFLERLPKDLATAIVNGREACDQQLTDRPRRCTPRAPRWIQDRASYETRTVALLEALARKWPKVEVVVNQLWTLPHAEEQIVLHAVAANPEIKISVLHGHYRIDCSVRKTRPVEHG